MLVELFSYSYKNKGLLNAVILSLQMDAKEFLILTSNIVDRHTFPSVSIKTKVKEQMDGTERWLAASVGPRICTILETNVG